MLNYCNTHVFVRLKISVDFRKNKRTTIPYINERANVRAIYTHDYTKLIVIVRRHWPRMAMPRVRVARNA